jgi:hypothetical protein
MTGHPSPFMAVLVALAAIAFVASPVLVPEFSGFRADQFPVPQVNAPVQPAGYAFAIWGVIYVWLLIGAGFGLIMRARALDWAPMRPALALSLAVGAAWLPVAILSPLGATALIWIMLISALTALKSAPALDRWMGRAPVALYAGWLTAASSVSIGLLLAGYGIMGQTAAAIVALVIALVIAVTVLSRVTDIAEYGVAVVWALVAVVVSNLTAVISVTALAAVGAAIVAATTFRNARR